jgi:hypothetical protein
VPSRIFKRVGIAVLVLTLTLVVAGGLRPSGSLATTQLDQAQETVDDLFRVQPNVASASYNGGGQTVTAGVSGELFAIELYLSRDGFTTKDLLIEIHANTPDGALLATSNPVAAADIPIQPDAAWLLITFPTPATIAAGDVFAIVSPFVPEYPTPDPAWYFGKAATDVYPGGVTWGGSIAANSWDFYVDGSDLAFRTYVRTGPPTCNFSAALGSGTPVDEISVVLGAELGLYGLDYPPNAEVTVDAVPPAGLPSTGTDTTDAFGNFAGTIVFQPGDEGDWTITAFATSDPECVDSVLIHAAAAAATPTPTPTPPRTATPTATATPVAAALPNTASPEGPVSPSWLLLVFGIVLTGSAAVVVGQRVARR